MRQARKGSSPASAKILGQQQKRSALVPVAEGNWPNSTRNENEGLVFCFFDDNHLVS
ncbi:MAG: hypothetical protein ACXVBT_09300 [Flavisolibacter sp.]